MQIEIDPDKCCGAGHCALQAPNVFDQDDDGVVILLQEHPTGDDARQAAAAAELCPTWAIIVHAEQETAV